MMRPKLSNRFGSSLIGMSHARIGNSPYRYRQTLLGADALLMLARARIPRAAAAL